MAPLPLIDSIIGSRKGTCAISDKMSFRDYVDPTENLYHGFIDEASVNSHGFIARVIRYVFYVEFYVRCDGQTPDEAPTAWNLCRNRHFFHAFGREKRKRKKKKERRKRRGKKREEEKRETLFQVSSNSGSRAAKVTNVFVALCQKTALLPSNASHLLQ